MKTAAHQKNAHQLKEQEMNSKKRQKSNNDPNNVVTEMPEAAVETLGQTVDSTKDHLDMQSVSVGSISDMSIGVLLDSMEEHLPQSQQDKLALQHPLLKVEEHKWLRSVLPVKMATVEDVSRSLPVILMPSKHAFALGVRACLSTREMWWWSSLHGHQSISRVWWWS